MKIYFSNKSFACVILKLANTQFEIQIIYNVLGEAYSVFIDAVILIHNRYRNKIFTLHVRVCVYLFISSDIKISVWRTIHDFHVLRSIFKIIFEMKYFHRNYFFLLIASALTLSLIHISVTTCKKFSGINMIP